jgi:hypothetical protein
LAGADGSCSRSRTVLLYSKRVMRRSGARGAGFTEQSGGVTPPVPPGVLLPLPAVPFGTPVLELPPPGPFELPGSPLRISAVQAERLSSPNITASAERGEATGSMLTLDRCECAAGNFPLFVPRRSSPPSSRLPLKKCSQLRKLQNDGVRGVTGTRGSTASFGNGIINSGHRAPANRAALSAEAPTPGREIDAVAALFDEREAANVGDGCSCQPAASERATQAHALTKRPD